MKEFKNILIRGTNWIGDAVMTLPAVTAIFKNYPQSEITVLTKPWAAEIYKAHNNVKNVLKYDKENDYKGLKGFLEFRKILKEKKFEAAFLFQNAFEAAFLSYAAKIPNIIGYKRDGRSFFLSEKIEITEEYLYAHETFYYLNILKKFGLEAPFSRPQLNITENPQVISILNSLNINNSDFVLAVAPGAAFGEAKRWPYENFAKTIELINEFKKIKVIILGSLSEIDICEKLNKILKVKAYNLAGKTDLPVSMGLLKRAGLLLCNDSGLMHLAGALNVPLVSVFGPTNPLTTAPLGLKTKLIRSATPCSPCLKKVCPLKEQICFQGISAEKVASEALSLINEEKIDNLGPAVFLDRDGTINKEVNYLARPEDMQLIEGAGKAIKNLNKAGFKVVVVSNQSGIARGYFTEEKLKEINNKMLELLKKEGAVIEALYYCPHHPKGVVAKYALNCNCRKPSSFLFEKAAQDLNINLENSFWVGDKLRDLNLKANYKTKSALVLTGHGLNEAKKELNKISVLPNIVAPDLLSASQWIIDYAQS